MKAKQILAPFEIYTDLVVEQSKRKSKGEYISMIALLKERYSFFDEKFKTKSKV